MVAFCEFGHDDVALPCFAVDDFVDSIHWASSSKYHFVLKISYIMWPMVAVESISFLFYSHRYKISFKIILFYNGRFLHALIAKKQHTTCVYGMSYAVE